MCEPNAATWGFLLRPGWVPFLPLHHLCSRRSVRWFRLLHHLILPHTTVFVKAVSISSSLWGRHILRYQTQTQVVISLNGFTPNTIFAPGVMGLGLFCKTVTCLERCLGRKLLWAKFGPKTCLLDLLSVLKNLNYLLKCKIQEV